MFECLVALFVVVFLILLFVLLLLFDFCWFGFLLVFGVFLKMMMMII